MAVLSSQPLPIFTACGECTSSVGQEHCTVRTHLELLSVIDINMEETVGGIAFIPRHVLNTVIANLVHEG